MQWKLQKALSNDGGVISGAEEVAGLLHRCSIEDEGLACALGFFRGWEAPCRLDQSSAQDLVMIELTKPLYRSTTGAAIFLPSLAYPLELPWAQNLISHDQNPQAQLRRILAYTVEAQ